MIVPEQIYANKKQITKRKPATPLKNKGLTSRKPYFKRLQKPKLCCKTQNYFSVRRQGFTIQKSPEQLNWHLVLFS